MYVDYESAGRASFLLMMPGGAIRRADADEVALAMHGMKRLQMFSQTRTRADGVVEDNSFDVSMKMFRSHLDSQISDLRLDADRADAFSPTLGSFEPNDLVQKMRQTLSEPMAPLSMEVFPTNNEIRPGAQFWRMQRSYATGEAMVYRGGDGRDVQDVQLAQAFLQRPVAYIISAFSLDWMTQMAQGFTGIDVRVRHQLAAMRLIREKENRLVFNGDANFDMYGAINHPFVDRYVLDVDFGTGAGIDMYKALVDAANYAEEVSKGTFRPDTLFISAELHNRASREFVSVSGNNTVNVMDAFLAACKHIQRVEKVYEFSGAGTGGAHLMMFCRTGAGRAGGGGIGDRSAEVLRVMNTTILPPNRTALMTRTFLMSAIGGLNQSEVGHNLIVEAFVTDS